MGGGGGGREDEVGVGGRGIEVRGWVGGGMRWGDGAWDEVFGGGRGVRVRLADTGHLQD